MKKIKKLTTALSLLVFILSPRAFAATLTSGPFNVTATVDAASQFTVHIFEETGTQANGDPILGPEVPSMDHGVLVRSNAPNGSANALRGKAFHVFLNATVGTPYMIKSSMGEMVSGVNTLPHALGLFPISAQKFDKTNVGTLVASQVAVGIDKLIYTSDATGTSALIELVYGLSGGLPNGNDPFPGWQPVPPDQAPGSYASTITFTLTD